jgi:GMC oxidoreductase
MSELQGRRAFLRAFKPSDIVDLVIVGSGAAGGIATDIAHAAGSLPTWSDPIGPQSLAVHFLGTWRMGNDRRTSVVDRSHRSHDVRNLFICDGSSMVSLSRGQPTETISALAFRAGAHRQLREARRNLNASCRIRQCAEPDSS